MKENLIGLVEKKCFNVKYEGKIFLIGIILGCIFSFMWQSLYFYSNKQDFNALDMIREDANIRLIKYIQGEWSSSIGDLLVKVDLSDTKDFIILEVFNKNKIESKYKITSVPRVNGLLGILDIEVCRENLKCSENTIIPVQFNKVFGKDSTITISYDSRLTYCVESDDKCTRAFKRIE